jgi:hypothetical protein
LIRSRFCFWAVFLQARSYYSGFSQSEREKLSGGDPAWIAEILPPVGRQNDDASWVEMLTLFFGWAQGKLSC